MDVSEDMRNFFYGLEQQYRVRTGGFGNPYSNCTVAELEGYVKEIERNALPANDAFVKYESALASVGSDKASSDAALRSADRDVQKHISLMEDKMRIISRLSSVSPENTLLTQERRSEFEDYLDRREHYDNGVGPYVKPDGGLAAKSNMTALMADNFMPQLDAHINSMTQQQLVDELSWQLPRLAELNDGKGRILEKLKQSHESGADDFSRFRQDLSAMHVGQSAHEYAIKIVQALNQIDPEKDWVSPNTVASLKTYSGNRNAEFAAFNKGAQSGSALNREVAMGSFFDRYNGSGQSVISGFRAELAGAMEKMAIEGEQLKDNGQAFDRSSNSNKIEAFYASEGFSSAGQKQEQLAVAEHQSAKVQQGMRI